MPDAEGARHRLDEELADVRPRVSCSSLRKDVIAAVVNPIGIRSKLFDDDVRGGMNIGGSRWRAREVTRAMRAAALRKERSGCCRMIVATSS